MLCHETDMTLGQWAQFDITVAIYFEVRNLPPQLDLIEPSPTHEVVIDRVVVTGFSTDAYDLDRAELEEQLSDGWLEYLDKRALSHSRELCKNGEWLEEDLIHVALFGEEDNDEPDYSY